MVVVDELHLLGDSRRGPKLEGAISRFRWLNPFAKFLELSDELRRLDAGSWFDPTFAGEKVPTVEEVLKLVAEYKQQDVLIAVDLRAKGIERDVALLAERYNVMNHLLFIGRTISERDVRKQLKQASRHAECAAVVNDPEEFPEALAATNADWVYFRYLPPKAQMDAVRVAGKRAFIAGPTVAGDRPENWRQAAKVGIDGILTDYPLELRQVLSGQQ